MKKSLVAVMLGLMMTVSVEESNPYAGMTIEEAYDSITIYPDNYYCGLCGYETKVIIVFRSNCVYLVGIAVNR